MPADRALDEGDAELRGFGLRRATAADAPCLAVLGTQVFLETYATSGIRMALVREVEAHLSMAAFLARLAEPSRQVTLAERAGHLVAFAELAIGARHPLVPGDHPAELCRLYVQSPFLRQGVGRLLLRRSEALAAAEGASTLWLTAWVGNARALAFYSSQGYETLGSTPYAFEGEVVENRLLAKALRDENRPFFPSPEE